MDHPLVARLSTLDPLVDVNQFRHPCAQSPSPRAKARRDMRPRSTAWFTLSWKELRNVEEKSSLFRVEEFLRFSTSGTRWYKYCTTWTAVLVWRPDSSSKVEPAFCEFPSRHASNNNPALPEDSAENGNSVWPECLKQTPDPKHAEMLQVCTLSFPKCMHLRYITWHWYRRCLANLRNFLCLPSWKLLLVAHL